MPESPKVRHRQRPNAKLTSGRIDGADAPPDRDDTPATSNHRLRVEIFDDWPPTPPITLVASCSCLEWHPITFPAGNPARRAAVEADHAAHAAAERAAVQARTAAFLAETEVEPD